MQMSYQLRIDKRSLKAAKFISRLQSAIQTALIESGLTQQEVAEKLGVDRSVVNRRLKGKANLTARSIADFAYALERDIRVDFVDPVRIEVTNWIATAVTHDDTLLQTVPNTLDKHVTTTSAKTSNATRFERLEA